MDMPAVALDPTRSYFHRENLRVRGEWLVMSRLDTKASERVEDRVTSESAAAKRVQQIGRELRKLRRKAG